MSDDEIGLGEWPDALDAYREAYELGRRIAWKAGMDSTAIIGASLEAERELARLKSRLGLRGLDRSAEVRVRAAIDRGEADGKAGVPPRW